MLPEIAFALCIALNTWLIGTWLAPRAWRQWNRLWRLLARSRRYLRARPTPQRESALQALTLRALRQLTTLLGWLALLLLALAPSLLFALFRADPYAALGSAAALAGMLLGLAACWLPRRSA